jgi:AraC-like DNA-binding protein
MASCMGVQFQPGGAFPFLGTPSGELHNRNVSLQSLWGRKAEELRERLLEARTPTSRLQTLEQTLLAQADPASQLHPAVSYALGEFQAVPQDHSIAAVANRTGVSPKWLSELFRAQVGLTPKVYCRLRRFQTALRFIAQQEQPDWADVALMCGYFDQAHFNRDFRAFSGLCPTQYVLDRSEHQNHVRVAD